MNPASPYMSVRNVCAMLAVATVLSAMGGCASSNQKSANAYKQSAVSAEKPADDPFEQGMNRPPTPKTLYSLAQMFEAQGKDAQADPVLRRIIAIEPRYMPAYCDLAEIQMRQRRIDDAERTLSAGVKFGPREPILLNNRGMCHLLSHDYDAALADFTQATALRPDDARCRSNMAVALAMLGRYDESLSLYTLVMPASDAYHNLAVLCDARGDSKGAAEYRTGKRPSADANIDSPAVKTVAIAPIETPAEVPTEALIATPKVHAAISAEPVAATPVAMPTVATPPIETAAIATPPADADLATADDDIPADAPAFKTLPGITTDVTSEVSIAPPQADATVAPPPAAAQSEQAAADSEIDDTQVEIAPPVSAKSEPVATPVKAVPTNVAGTSSDDSEQADALPGEDNG